ncbi:MAG: 4Fe-4S binding protein, partial [Actinobacteria bacterium]|nr:4Fe-4S binding protein [Actinomycetota bacterium]
MEENVQVLYQKHIPIVTRSVKGKFRTFKTAVTVLAFTVFFLLPWLPWDRVSAANQAILFDLTSRRFFIFNLIVYPQDVFWLAMLLFIAAAFLFFATGLIGRAWCGYFCFQTIWSDIFIKIEHLIQGERPARLRLQKQEWNLEKVFKLGLSHALM